MKAIDKKVTVGTFRLHFQKRDKAQSFGRFGGGWNWNVGIQAGGRTVIINLLVCSLRIGWGKA